MTDLSGTHLGPYEIRSLLGVGGMGEVWRAKDTRLDREVAVKVLPQRFASDEEMRRRFEREARMISQLSHPNICSIFDVGSEAGSSFLVMELLEGESLAQRLTRGALTPAQALRIGRDVCAALETAHRKGIVHRDLKPANIFLSSAGTKLLDFGLAKLRERLDEGDASRVATEKASPITAAGSILGTLAYMAPEQLEGKPADARTDIFALGSVLFEMLTGRRPFTGDTSTAIIAQILTSEPPLVSTVCTLTPRALDRAVRACLAKQPEERWQSASDLARELAWIEADGSDATNSVTDDTRRLRPGRESVAWVAAGLLLALCITLLVRARFPHLPQPGVVRFSIPLPPGGVYDPVEVSRGVAVSPDGTRLVIEAIVKGARRLFVRALDSDRAIEIEGTEGAGAPFWSPDGRSIAFFSYGRLKKVPAGGGATEDLCEAHFDVIGTWNRDGTILFADFKPPVPAIYRVSDKGGEPVLVTSLDKSRGDTAHAWPQFLPDGKHFLFSSRIKATRRETDRELRIGSLDEKKQVFIATMGSRVEYAAGFVLFGRDAALYAQAFDLRTFALSGEPQLLADNVRCFFGPGNVVFSASEAGVIAYQTATPSSRLVWLDGHGAEIATLGQPAAITGVRISPDGTRVALALEDRRSGTSDIWVVDPSLNVSTRLHTDLIDEKSPVWSPDGSKVAYRSDRDGAPDIEEITVASPGSERMLLAKPGVQQPEDVSRDGRLLLFTDDVRTTSSKIRLLPLDADSAPIPWLETRFRQTNPRFSPDARWIAYESDESGESEIYVALTKGGGEKRRVSPSGGRLPRWRGNGSELTYLAPDGTMMSVAMAGPRAANAAAVRLFRFDPPIEMYDVSPDGSRFLASVPVEKVRESPIRVIVNWPALLRTER